MDRRFHIIITSEQGRARTFAISKRIVKKSLALLIVVFVFTLVAGATYSVQRFNLKKIDHLESNVANLSNTNRSLQDERESQLAGAYGELNRRNRVIESILSTLNISTPQPSPEKDRGGPFTSIAARPYDDLIFRVDQDIETILSLPLGYPVKTIAVTSGFGARLDPVNGEKSFHDGVDLRGNYSSTVKATAGGEVIEKGYNADYGWYVLIDHGNKFTTLYAHNQKVLIKQGDKVVRGQAIALLGSTGRSTGPHLHYEIRRDNRPVNPSKFLNIANLLTGNFS